MGRLELEMDVPTNALKSIVFNYIKTIVHSLNYQNPPLRRNHIIDRHPQSIHVIKLSI